MRWKFSIQARDLLGDLLCLGADVALLAPSY